MPIHGRGGGSGQTGARASHPMGAAGKKCVLLRVGRVARTAAQSSIDRAGWPTLCDAGRPLQTPCLSPLRPDPLDLSERDRISTRATCRRGNREVGHGRFQVWSTRRGTPQTNPKLRAIACALCRASGFQSPACAESAIDMLFWVLDYSDALGDVVVQQMRSVLDEAPEPNCRVLVAKLLGASSQEDAHVDRHVAFGVVFNAIQAGSRPLARLGSPPGAQAVAVGGLPGVAQRPDRGSLGALPRNASFVLGRGRQPGASAALLASRCPGERLGSLSIGFLANSRVHHATLRPTGVCPRYSERPDSWLRTSTPRRPD